MKLTHISPLSGATLVMASTTFSTGAYLTLSPFTSRIASPGNNPERREEVAMNLTPFYSLFCFLSPFPSQFLLSSSYSFSLNPHITLIFSYLSSAFPFLPLSSSTTTFFSATFSFLSLLRPSLLLPPSLPH